MSWLIIIVIYFLIGLAVLAWSINRDRKINPKNGMSLERMLIFPELCLLLLGLLWPFIIFSEIKHGRTAHHIGNENIE